MCLGLPTYFFVRASSFSNSSFLFPSFLFSLSTVDFPVAFTAQAVFGCASGKRDHSDGIVLVGFVPLYTPDTFHVSSLPFIFGFI